MPTGIRFNSFSLRPDDNRQEPASKRSRKPTRGTGKVYRCQMIFRREKCSPIYPNNRSNLHYTHKFFDTLTYSSFLYGATNEYSIGSGVAQLCARVSAGAPI